MSKLAVRAQGGEESLGAWQALERRVPWSVISLVFVVIVVFVLLIDIN